MEIVLLITITIIIFFIFFQKSWCGSVGDKNRGNAGERKVSSSLNFHLDEKTYCILNDVIISDNIGGTTQIDHVVLSPFGIFVVETKNLKGWIFGSVNSKMWMLQVFNEKYQFYNPIKQNYKHIACLSKLTKLPKKYFFPDCCLCRRIFYKDKSWITRLCYHIPPWNDTLYQVTQTADDWW